MGLKRRARGPEWTEARQFGILDRRAVRQAGEASAERVPRAEHRLAQIAVGVVAALVGWQEGARGHFSPANDCSVP